MGGTDGAIHASLHATPPLQSIKKRVECFHASTPALHTAHTRSHPSTIAGVAHTLRPSAEQSLTERWSHGTGADGASFGPAPSGECFRRFASCGFFLPRGDGFKESGCSCGSAGRGESNLDREEKDKTEVPQERERKLAIFCVFYGR